MIISSSNYSIIYDLEVSGWSRDVGQINIYDDNGIIFKTDSGYFEDMQGNPIRSIVLNTEKEIKLKRKLKFDGNIFVMTLDKYGDKQWNLYIPNTLLNFEYKGRELKEGFGYHIFDKYLSNEINAKHLSIVEGLGINQRTNTIQFKFNEIKEELDLINLSDSAKIIEKLNVLRALAKEYEVERGRILSLDIDTLEPKQSN